MKRLCRLLIFGCAAFLTGLPALAVDRAAVLRAAHEVAQKARYATFITIGEDGQPQARIVDALGPDEEFTVWVGTNPVTRKVAEIAKDPRVTVSFFDPSGLSYVTLVGTARLVTDPAVKAKHWKGAWASFYKNEHRGALLSRVLRPVVSRPNRPGPPLPGFFPPPKPNPSAPLG